MPLEAGTYINDLVTSNPVGATDLKAQGDDHLRLIKAVLKTTFPNASKPFYLPSSVALSAADVTLVSTDENKVIRVSTEAANRTVNLPATSGLPDGWSVTIVKSDHSANLLTIDGNGGDTLNGALTQILHQRFQKAILTWCSTIGEWYADVNDIIPIGAVAPVFTSTLPPGWLYLAGASIGNAASAATARANADTLGLFSVLWNSMADAQAAVSGGRGLSAAADFAANKRITIPDTLGRVLANRDTTGARLTGSYFGASGSVLGTTGGLESHTLSEAQLASHAHGAAAAAAGSHAHTATPTNGGAFLSFGSTADNLQINGGTSAGGSNITVSTAPDHVHGITVNPAGSGVAHNNVQPTIISNFIIKY